jgi:hypothetical protein
MEIAVQAAPDRQISLTDPDARAMATSGKGTGIVGYNVQTAVDVEHHLIVAPISGSVIYRPDPVEPPADGNLLICCSQPQGDIVSRSLMTRLPEIGGDAGKATSILIRIRRGRHSYREEAAFDRSLCGRRNPG